MGWQLQTGVSAMKFTMRLAKGTLLLSMAGAAAVGLTMAAWQASAREAAPQAATGGPVSAVDVATFTPDGLLRRPANLDEWVFLGASLGMGYNARAFDPNAPGQFQVVLMEPQAYRRFVDTGAYPDGAMFLLSFYDSEQKVSINRSGFVQRDLDSFEIHLIDKRRPGEGHYFYPYGASDAKAAVLPPGNACITCHLKNGAFSGTFAQFYPTIRHRIPAARLQEHEAG
jgi:hypothetical protein